MCFDAQANCSKSSCNQKLSDVLLILLKECDIIIHKFHPNFELYKVSVTFGRFHSPILNPYSQDLVKLSKFYTKGKYLFRVDEALANNSEDQVFPNPVDIFSGYISEFKLVFKLVVVLFIFPGRHNSFSEKAKCIN